MVITGVLGVHPYNREGHLFPRIPRSGDISHFSDSPAGKVVESRRGVDRKRKHNSVNYIFSLFTTLVERFKRRVSGNAFSKCSLQNVSSTFMLGVEPMLVMMLVLLL